VSEKKSRPSYHISLYIIIPVILAGLAILCSVITYQIVESGLKTGDTRLSPIVWVTLFEAIGAYLIGFALVRILLQPMEKFIAKARELPVLSGTGLEPERATGVDRLEQFDKVFRQVTSVLSKLDARQLFPEIIGESHAMRGILSQVKKVSPSDSTVMISGESGTGKELVATSIVRHSTRAGGPFIKLNCVAIPESLWESELFGHEKGSFTGAIERKIGKFELADGGTLFLDEIGDMPLSTQAKILRALQEREFERVGGSRSIRVDVRFIAATNKNLDAMVKEGRFREDLYYRLNVFNIQLPPLRERKEDIPLLVDFFLDRGPKAIRLKENALHVLLGYNWPGNVRELQNTIERASVMTEGNEIETEHLPAAIRGEAGKQLCSLGSEAIGSIDERIEEIEKAMIVDALQRCDGVQARAAKLLGIKDRSLWHRIKKYGIDPAGFKQ
jgi:transcriptional regulator with PAS, ATPase and Fis domain